MRSSPESGSIRLSVWPSQTSSRLPSLSRHPPHCMSMARQISKTSAQAAEAFEAAGRSFCRTDLCAWNNRDRSARHTGSRGLTAYAIGEGRKWPVGLSRKPRRAIAFYAVLAFSVLVGIGLNFTPLDPIKAVYWSAVINGVLAPPVMVLMMLLVRRKKVMGELKVEGWLYWLGWLATATMALSIVGMAFSLVSG